MHEDAADGTGADAAPEGDEPDTDAAPADEDAAGEATDLADRVAAYDDELGAAVGNLEERVEELEAELAEKRERTDDLESRLKRKQADFQNYKKRAKKRQEEIKERATEDFVTRLVPVRDDLVRALDQDEDVDIRDGVESTLESFDRVLDEENVTPIEPSPGDEVDPTRHQVMMRVESDQSEGTVVDVYRPGYEMAEKVIQEAQVTVSDGE
ncbi:nucleotide exchange factor GrpE [Haloplanus aerogenes]|uniref:Protein GrpE n=1 Tax=Haloplanus aerogenes TaxID=660522 RepID=A0A3M0E0X2_9EURY|nr:nucleotide exchange factor GrpE [Haloplanus aerogenes]AZH25823.1 nucleotide exchange factor GrpE [Haloplanus aerogenes]RMB25566.1 molecular chaperone GrpE [Haloplanus aerogenes]